jgi:hypothetical protein
LIEDLIMLGRVVWALFVLPALAAAPGSAFEVNAEVRHVDAEKRVLIVFGGGQERTLGIDPAAKFLDAEGKTLTEGLGSSALKPGTAVTLSVERGPGRERPSVFGLRLGHHAAGKGPGPGARPGGPPTTGKTSVGFKPLDEMTADDRHQGEDGGLYGGGKNVPPPSHAAAAKQATAQIVPRDESGKPVANGRIVVVSISMSNATQEYSRFKQLADADPRKSPQVAVVDCAQGGQAMAEWVDPAGRPWQEAERRLQAAGVSPAQVQVVWIKSANKSPSGDLSEHGRKLANDTAAVIRNAKQKFPNLQIAYLGSRIYGGYSDRALNPEPYAYEGAFAVRWLIQDQIAGRGELNYDAKRGPVQAPVLLWGPYFWADGTTPRKSDGPTWGRADLSSDGVHPSDSGRQKVAELLLRFFTTDADARTWFVKSP